MYIVFRTDASLSIGNGHVMRCLTLAYKLRSEGWSVEFICRARSGHLIEKIKTNGFHCFTLPYSQEIDDEEPENLSSYWVKDANETIAVLNQPADWIVIDHYGLDWQWETVVKSKCMHLMAIDDLANRKHRSSILVDNNIGRATQDYVTLVNPECTLLLGPHYAIIRDEFTYIPHLAIKNTVDVTTSTVPLKILISMGGVDKRNLTAQVLGVLLKIQNSQHFEIRIILGPHSPWNQQIAELIQSSESQIRLFIDPPNVASLMSDVDIGIGTCGVSAIERCSLQVPSINFAIAENQLLGGLGLEKIGACHLIKLTSLWEIEFTNAFNDLSKPASRQAMHHACAHVVDGSGTQKIVEAMSHGQ